MKTLYRSSSVFSLVGILMAIAGCSTAPSGPGGETAGLRLLQADPAVTQSVDLAVDGSVVARGVSYGAASGVVRMASGTHRLSVMSGSSVLAERQGLFAAGTTYYAVSAAGQLVLTQPVIPDTGQRQPARANIRFVNIPGAQASPALVTAILSAPATVDTTQRFEIDTRIARYGSLMYLNPGSITVRIQPVGEATVLAEVTFPVAAGEVKAVVLERNAAGALVMRVLIEE